MRLKLNFTNQIFINKNIKKLRSLDYSEFSKKIKKQIN